MKQLKILYVALFSILLLSMQLEGQDIPVSPPASLVAIAADSFHEYDSGNTLDSLIESGPDVPKKLTFSKTYDSVVHTRAVPSDHPYPNSHIAGLVRDSKFVGYGIPLKRWSYPTKNNNFAFSIYLVRVTESLSRDGQGALPGQTIYIVRAGGPVSFKGYDIRATDSEFHLFHLNSEYLFFGKQLAGDLFKVDSESSLLIDNSRIIESSTHEHHPDLYRDRGRDSLTSEVRAAGDAVAQAKKGNY